MLYFIVEKIYSYAYIKEVRTVFCTFGIVLPVFCVCVPKQS